MPFPGLTAGEDFVYQWQYGLAGDFKRSLALTISLADTSNLVRLGMGFPEEVNAMYNYMNTDGWWQELQEKCKKLGYLK